MSGDTILSTPSMMNSCVGRLSLLRSETLTPKNRKPGIGRKMLNSLDTSSIGPLWHIAHRPLVEPGVMGTLSNIARPRFSDAVTPFGSRGAGPPLAKRKSGRDEKKRGDFFWNSAMSSSWRGVGSALYRGVAGPAPSAGPSGVLARPSYRNIGWSDGVLRVVGVPRRNVTLV